MKEGDWVKAKHSGGIRFVTKVVNNTYFEDDGKMSRQKPSTRCHIDEYEVIDIGNEIYNNHEEINI